MTPDKEEAENAPVQSSSGETARAHAQWVREGTVPLRYAEASASAGFSTAQPINIRISKKSKAEAAAQKKPKPEADPQKK